MVLEDDMARLIQAVLRPLGELGSGNLFFPVVGPEFILYDLRAVEPMFYVRAVHYQASQVPLAYRL